MSIPGALGTSTPEPPFWAATAAMDCTLNTQDLKENLTVQDENTDLRKLVK